MKKIYVSPKMVAEEISVAKMITISGPQPEEGNATKTGGDEGYEGESLSKGFSNFSMSNSDWE